MKVFAVSRHKPLCAGLASEGASRVRGAIVQKCATDGEFFHGHVATHEL